MGVALLGLLESEGLEMPSCVSRSRKSDHSSARDSLLVRVSSCESDGVLGVRRNGDMGTRRALLDAPGRARPACSFCSVTILELRRKIRDQYMYLRSNSTARQSAAELEISWDPRDQSV
jgi:hypothetical protein